MTPVRDARLRSRARSAPSTHRDGGVQRSPGAAALPPLGGAEAGSAHRRRDDGGVRGMLLKEDAVTRSGRSLHSLGHPGHRAPHPRHRRRATTKARDAPTAPAEQGFPPPPDPEGDVGAWLQYWATPRGVAHATHVFAGRVEWGLRDFVLPRWGDEEGAIILGEGGDGVAWFAVEKTHMIPCVLKELYNGGGDREILIHNALEHPAVVQFYTDFMDEERGSQFIVLEFCAGGSLFDHLPEEGGVDEAAARAIVAMVTDALQYLHGVGVVYADLKTANILVTAEGRLKLADFGAAHWVADRKRKLLRMTGTVDTQPPEMVSLSTPRDAPLASLAKSASAASLEAAPADGPRTPSPTHTGAAGGFDERVDNWSLGVLLYRLLVGDYPFSFDVDGDDDDDDIIRGNILSLSYCIPQDVPPHARALIRGLLQPTPADRLSLEHVAQHAWLLGHLPAAAPAAGTSMDFPAAAAQEAAAWRESLRFADLRSPNPTRGALSLWGGLADLDGPITKQTFFTSLVLVYLFGCFTVLHLQAHYGRRC